MGEHNDVVAQESSPIAEILLISNGSSDALRREDSEGDQSEELGGFSSAFRPSSTLEAIEEDLRREEQERKQTTEDDPNANRPKAARRRLPVEQSRCCLIL
jgi:hypothetical protein